MSDVVTALDTLDLAVSRAEGLVDEAALKEASAAADRIRDRRGFLGQTLVLALAGGTGSGKSSLLNAIADQHVTETGVLRPTTEEALAWIPAGPEPGLVDLLDRLEIRQRVEQTLLPRLAIIDLPDHDSVVLQHHLMVERMLPEVDGVIWVFDPQKYRDPLIHNDYIAQLLDYQDQFLFALNQVDLLGQNELAELRADLTRSLQEDGVHSPRIFETAADPPRGAPRNIEALREFLDEQLDDKAVSTGKLLGDIRRAGRRLGDEAGLLSGAGVGYEERWPSVRDSVVEAVTDGLGFDDAVCRVGDFLTALSVETGGRFGSRLRGEFSYPMIEKELGAAIAASGVGPPARSPRRGLAKAFHTFWFGDADGEVVIDRRAGVLSEELDGRFGAGMRGLLWERAELGATLALVEIEARQAAGRS